MADASPQRSDAPAVDFDVLRTATGGDRDLMQELAELFLGDADLKLRALPDALDTDDMQRIRSIGHALKGASASIGARPAADAFGRLERAAKEGDRDGVRQAIVEGRERFEDVRKALADLR